MRFLVVDDEAYISEEMKRILSSLYPDADVLIFTHPERALEAAQQHSIDVAFLDIKMRGLSGLELAVKLKKIKPDTHIIFVTGFACLFTLSGFSVTKSKTTLAEGKDILFF